MKNHVHADRPWDTYTIVTVMRGFLPTIFADLFPDPFRAKEFLAGILQVVKVRNDRSHQIRLTEASVLNAMHQMGRVLKLAGLSDAATNIDSILEKAKHILAECPNEGEHIFTLDLSKEECNTQLLYVSMNAFEAHLEAQIASFQYQDKTIGTPTSRAFHLERQITIPPLPPFLLHTCPQCLILTQSWTQICRISWNWSSIGRRRWQSGRRSLELLQGISRGLLSQDTGTSITFPNLSMWPAFSHQWPACLPC